GYRMYFLSHCIRGSLDCVQTDRNVAGSLPDAYATSLGSSPHTFHHGSAVHEYGSNHQAVRIAESLGQCVSIGALQEVQHIGAGARLVSQLQQIQGFADTLTADEVANQTGFTSSHARTYQACFTDGI